MKRSRVDALKKQKESASQFKTFMAQKNKELIEARKVRMKEKRDLSKLEVENRKLNDMMGRKVKAHQKTEQALQRNKQHLVKLLAERKREQQRQRSNKRRQANNTAASNKKKAQAGGNSSSTDKKGGSSSGSCAAPSDDVLTWAPEDQKIRSSKFFILEMLNMRVAKKEREEKEERLQNEYDLLQQMVFEEVETLNRLKESVLTAQETVLQKNSEKDENTVVGSEESLVTNDADEDDSPLQALNTELIEQEERLESLILKMSLVGESLSELHLPAFEEENEHLSTNSYDDEMREIDMIAQMEAPMLRTVFWSLLEGHSECLYEKHKLAQQLRLKQAEACAAEERAHSIEQDNSRLKRGFYERVNILEHERTDLVQAICSPVKKRSDNALMSLNNNLEAKLNAEKELNAKLEMKLKEMETKAMELDESLQVARNSEVSTTDDSGGDNLSKIVEDLQKVWGTIELESSERYELLNTIMNANISCALTTLDNGEQQLSVMKEETEKQTNYLKKIDKVLFSLFFSFSAFFQYFSISIFSTNFF